MKPFLALALAVVTALAINCQAATDLPITGEPVPPLAAFDTAVISFMRANSIKGGALAIMKDGRLVLKHGYGWSDQALTVPYDPDRRARVASNGKEFTAAAIWHLIQRGVIQTNTLAIPLTQIEPYNGVWGDTRWRDVNVLQLIAHRSGWDNDIPSWFTVSETLGLDHPATMREFISYLTTRRLKSEPGTRFAYSSPTYGILALVIEKASDTDCFTYIQRHVTRTWGIRNVGIERTEPKLRALDEPYYDDSGSAGPDRDLSAFPTDERVPQPDGGDYFHESTVGPGGLIASVEALVTLGQCVLISHGSGFSPAAGIPSLRNGERRQWRHLGMIGAQLGGQEAASSFNFQNTNGVDFAFFFNRSFNSDPAILVRQLKALSESTTEWPGDNSTAISLAADSFQVGEDERELVIGVRRLGDTRGEVSAQYATLVDGSAQPGVDFTSVSGVVTFADDEITQTITIPILDDPRAQGTRHFVLALSNPTGGSRLNTASATIEIEDDNIPPVAPSVRIVTPVTETVFVAGTTNVVISPEVTLGNRPLSKIEFFSGATLLGEENKPPYAFTWKKPASGSYLLSVRATDDRSVFSVSPPVRVHINGPSMSAHGLLLETWTRRPGSSLTNLTFYGSFPARCTGWQLVENFEAPTNWSDYYGARLRGYVVPPETGAYTFWIAANDQAQLRLSTDEQPANSRLIAVSTNAPPRQWEHSAFQQSAAVVLEAGRRYYVEALHKERIGSDHLAVGWQLPNGNFERPIPGIRLTPFSAEPLPVLESSSQDATGFTFIVRASSTAGQLIETSTDLVTWLPFRTNSAPELVSRVTDPDARTLSRRSYRVRVGSE